jgi:hypothetical protein
VSRGPGRARRAGTTLGAAVLLCLAACGPAGPPPAVSREAAAARVGERLYAENLIADPEVAARVRRAVAAIDRDGAAPDSVLPGLHGWLEGWVARHPDRAARARLMPGPGARTPSAAGARPAALP